MTRLLEVRDAACFQLETMTDPEHGLVLGLLADYHETCGWLRLSADKEINDPALYLRKCQKMFDAWHSHYVRGEVVATNGNNTYSAAVLRQLMHGRMLRGQNKALVCGFDKDTTFVKSALQRMVNICECAKRQILATMFQGSVLRALCSFDLSYWKDIEEWEVGSEDQRALAK